MKDLFDQIEGLLVFESWSLKIVTVIIVATLLHILANYFLHYAQKMSNITKNIWVKSLVEAAKLPLRILIWLVSIKLSISILIKGLYGQDPNLIAVLIKISVITCFAWFLLRLVNYFSRDLISSGKISKKSFDHTTIDALSKLARIIVIIFSGLAIIQNLGFSISGILAAGGAGGLVIGFAAKDLFANFFGGLTIYLDRPFSVGDWIRCDEKQIEGTVEYIGWRHTRLRAFNKNPIYVPNAIFSTVVVENPSRMTNRRINEIVGLRYCDIDKMAVITAAVENMIDNHAEIDQERIKIVKFEKFNSSSVDFNIYVFLKTTDWLKFTAVKQDILLKTAEIIADHGAEIAFPTRTLHIDKGL